MSDVLPHAPARSNSVDDIFPTVIPVPGPDRRRTLVLCFDGTGDQFDNDNSNIVELFSMLKKDDRTQQMVYYQAGIGTYTSPKSVTPFSTSISKMLDMCVAKYLNQHVMEGYEFLMQNYIAGDKICLFGFSRGAYTAQALSGMIHKVGLLPASNYQQVPFAWKMYRRDDEDGWEQSRQFKQAFSIDVDIDFVGVWDTVNSVGILPKRLPFTTSNYAVRTFRHALSLDERRAKFKANTWNRPTPQQAALGTQPEHRIPKRRYHVRTDIPGSEKLKAKMSWKKTKTHDIQREVATATPTDIKEVWFAGAHCDVGGGSVTNDTPHALARIPLRWMIQECFRCNTGILFESDKIEEIGLPAESLWPTVIHPSELEVEELYGTNHSHSSSPSSTPKTPLFSNHAQEATLVPESPEPGPGAGTDAVPSRPALGSPIDTSATLTEKPTAAHSDHSGPGDVSLLAKHGAHFDYAAIERADALSPIYDQLSLNWRWWILEVIPLKQRYQDSDDDNWKSEFSINLGRGRHIPQQIRKGFLVHSSVKTRMEALGYKPRTLWKIDPTWVD
ncbi:hypothetical protein BOTBODRAFT_135627 [Botryobasidium botryosum FD-172 SS1]|uniref:T6SS Phospholipase effector Tle1-like catalytic domain-containing protein n=1 Tax=Botryobasidium botryosum (strain FD-172 SS1) TaxID=930990 RepID=A0A067MJ19_BOTB1|nr:hypothetical protein BOTBODRAFT_135627 [Botryobasidium botryosum FD-172 SS1]